MAQICQLTLYSLRTYIQEERRQIVFIIISYIHIKEAYSVRHEKNQSHLANKRKEIIDQLYGSFPTQHCKKSIREKILLFEAKHQGEQNNNISGQFIKRNQSCLCIYIECANSCSISHEKSIDIYKDICFSTLM